MIYKWFAQTGTRKRILDPSLYNLIYFKKKKRKQNKTKNKQKNKNTKMQHKTKKLQKRPIYCTRQGKMY